MNLKSKKAPPGATPSFKKGLVKHLRDKTPVEISKALGKNYHHIILHRANNSYSFTVFWWDHDYTCEPVATSIKPYRTKAACIKAIKKLSDTCPSAFSEGYACYDNNGKMIDVKIRYDVKRLL